MIRPLWQRALRAALILIMVYGGVAAIARGMELGATRWILGVAGGSIIGLALSMVQEFDRWSGRTNVIAAKSAREAIHVLQTRLERSNDASDWAAAAALGRVNITGTYRSKIPRIDT
jgi:hypothetical protein